MLRGGEEGAGPQVDGGDLGEGGADVGTDGRRSSCRDDDVPVAVTATIGGSRTSAAESDRSGHPGRRPQLEIDGTAAGADPGHGRGRSPARRPPGSAPGTERPNRTRTGPRRRPSGYTPRWPRRRTEQARRLRQPGCPRSGRASTARTAGAQRSAVLARSPPPASGVAVHDGVDQVARDLARRGATAEDPIHAELVGGKLIEARAADEKQRTLRRAGTPPGTPPTSPWCCAGARRVGSPPG